MTNHAERAVDRSRRTLLRAMLVPSAMFPAGAYAARTAPKSVAVLLGPTRNPDPIGPAKRAWGDRFAKHGLGDGKEIEISVYRGPDRDYMRAGAPQWERVARQAVDSRPAVMVMQGAWLPFVRRMTRDVPLVFFGANIDIGHDTEYGIDSLRRPGGNVTGMDTFPTEHSLKKIQMLKELRPAAARHATVGLAPTWMAARMKGEANKLGMDSVLIHMFIDPPVADVVAALRGARIEVAEFLWNSGNRVLHDELAKLRVATSFPHHGSVKAGGLFSYQPADDVLATVVTMAARILRGEPVSAIPVEQPREYRLAINLRRARTLDITVPPSFLVRAHETFE
jgi:putative tryptophan/tyrosine transport system substrate-binding protein